MKRMRAPLITAIYVERVPEHPVVSVADPPKEQFECDHCGKTCEGSPFGTGLLVWFRGDEMRIEEPPFCKDCSSRITMGAVSKWAIEGEEEG